VTLHDHHLTGSRSVAGRFAGHVVQHNGEPEVKGAEDEHEEDRNDEGHLQRRGSALFPPRAASQPFVGSTHHLKHLQPAKKPLVKS
jgi:hypothetical protein